MVKQFPQTLFETEEAKGPVAVKHILLAKFKEDVSQEKMEKLCNVTNTTASEPYSLGGM